MSICTRNVLEMKSALFGLSYSIPGSPTNNTDNDNRRIFFNNLDKFQTLFQNMNETNIYQNVPLFSLSRSDAVAVKKK